MTVVIKNNWMVLPKKPDPNSNFEILTKAIVDGDQWYTVRCSKEASMWIRKTYPQHENKMWFENIDQRWQLNRNVYDMHEKLYTLLALAWKS